MAETGQPNSRVLRDLIPANEDHGSNRYTYLPLPPKCIRLLVLAPGQRGTELYGRIVLHEPDEVDYGALSYVWGDSHLTRSIHIDDETLPITESLYSALQQMREIDEEHWIWVDQICIDQESVADRSGQVGRMGEIYGKADHVVAWLGEATAATDYIFRSLNKVGDGANPNLSFYGNEELQPGQPIYESMNECLNAGLRAIYHDGTDEPDFEDITRRAVHSILDLPWFERTWTVQEAVLCEKLFLAAGDLEVTWRKFYGLLKAMPDLPRPKAVHYDIELARNFSCYGRKTTNIYKLVDTYQKRQATDPRDKIYGLMGMLDSKGRPAAADKYGMAHESNRAHSSLPHVDYSKSTEQVYMDFSLWCISTTGDLEALTRCCSEYRPNEGFVLPSWARNWTQKLDPIRCGYLIGNVLDDSVEPFTASCDLKAQVRGLLCFPYDRERRGQNTNNLGAGFAVGESNSVPVDITIQEIPTTVISSLEGSTTDAILVKGLQFDIIEETVDRVHIKGFVGDTQSETWKEWRHFAIKHRTSGQDQYPGHLSRIDALWRTLINDQQAGHEDRAGPEDGEYFEMMLDADMPLCDANSAAGESNSQDEKEDQQDLIGWLYDHDTTLLGRKLFRTQKGYLGMTCQHVRGGDKVAVLWGGRLPFVLREKGLVVLDPETGCAPQIVMSHVLVGGECYVHGLADGQAVELARTEHLIDAEEICIV
jgi:hypothetical protein